MTPDLAPKLSRILCVDDEPDIRTIAKLALEIRGGYHVTTCSSGREALLRIMELDPQLVLLDVMMPGMDGCETLARLRALPAFARTPVAFLTATTQSSEVSAWRALGVIAVLSKPFNPMSLADDVAALWRAVHDPGAGASQVEDPLVRRRST